MWFPIYFDPIHNFDPIHSAATNIVLLPQVYDGQTKRATHLRTIFVLTPPKIARKKENINKRLGCNHELIGMTNPYSMQRPQYTTII